MGSNSQGSFSHLDPQGNAHMVDVSEKPVTRRVAEAPAGSSSLPRR
jgi:molybdenum cofactor biosynthesis enzyme